MKWRDVPWPMPAFRDTTYWGWRFEFKREDAWIGAYWHHSPAAPRTDVWVCLVPMVPLHIRIDDAPF